MSDSPSQVEPYGFSAALTLCLDIRDPLSCLALRPALALGSELGIDLQCLPFAGKPLKPPSVPGPDDDRGAKHRRYRAQYQEKDITRYAAVQGIELRDIYRWPDAEHFALSLLWLDEQEPRRVPGYLVAAFSGYWSAGLDIESPAALSSLLQAEDQDPEAFETFIRETGPGRLSELRSALVAAGVFAPPSLVVEGEVFLGRAHLPMVRWALGGRNGPPPI
jgi:2-hydroxychromene-2-carboxylate isomerase